MTKMKNLIHAHTHTAKYYFAGWLSQVLLLIILSVMNLAAQEEPFKCGTEVSPSLYQHFMKEVRDITARNLPDGPEIVPVRFTFIQSIIPDQVFTQSQADFGIANLNTAYAGTGLTFIQCGPINNIRRNEIYQNNDVDNFTTSFSYSSGTVEVYIMPKAPNPYAGIPCPVAFLDGNPNYSICNYNNDNIVVLQAAADLGPCFPHEVGHHFGLFHTFGNPVNRNPTPAVLPYLDQPYPWYTDPILKVYHPLWWGRELVTRVITTTNLFNDPNFAASGDLLKDTPPDCAPGYPSIFPGCSFAGFNTNTCEFNALMTETDYNGEPLFSPAVNSTIAHNYMSYWGGNCRNQFTNDQKNRIWHYYSSYRAPKYRPDACGSFESYVLYENTDIGLPLTTIRVRHADPSIKSNMTTMSNGEFYGILHANTLTAGVFHNGFKKTLKFANDPIKMHYDHTYCEWLKGVTSQDLADISKHILGSQPFTTGYQMIAADVNKSGTITTFDIVQLRKLILDIYEELPNQDQPFRFMPEFIPQNYAAQFNVNPFGMVINGVNVGSEYLNPTWSFSFPPNASKGFDFVKIGDVNHSWPTILANEIACVPEGVTPEAPGPPVDAPALLVPNIALSAGSTISIKFKTGNFTGVTSFQFGLNLPADKFELLDVLTPGNTLSDFSKEDNFGLTKISRGELRGLWFDATTQGSKTLADNTAIFELIVTVKQNIANLQSEIHLDNGILQNMVGRTGNDVWTNPVSFILLVEPAPVEGRNNRTIVDQSKFQCLPNPFDQTIQLHFDSDAKVATQGNLNFYGTTGALLFSDTYQMNPGENIISVAQSNGLPSGVYWITMSVGSDTWTRKIVKQ